MQATPDPAPGTSIERAAWPAGKAAVVVLIASICFATSGPLARVAYPADPLVIAAGRTALAGGLLLAASAGPTARAVRALSWGKLAQIAGAGALLAAHFWCFLAGLASTSLPAAVTLVSLEPIAVVLTAWAAFGARPSRGEGVGVALATLGALVLVLVGLKAGAGGASRGEHTLGGDLLVLAAVALYGLYLGAAKALAGLLPAGAYASLVYLSAGALLAAGAALSGATLALPQGAWLAIAALGIIPTLGGHTLVQWATRHVPASVVALVSPGETVGSLLISAALLGEAPRGLEWLGALLSLGGVGVTLLAQRQRTPAA
jgi:drug/metabolite transporter (DMT)-like permease